MVCEEQSKVRAGLYAWKVLEKIRDHHHHHFYSHDSYHPRAGSIQTTSAIFERPSCFFLSQFLPPPKFSPPLILDVRLSGLIILNFFHLTHFYPLILLSKISSNIPSNSFIKMFILAIVLNFQHCFL